MKAIRIKVEGRVQGVWFRASTRDEADRLRLDGWVKNTPDGAVEIHAQGDPGCLDNLLIWCHHGPSGARVDRVDSSNAEPINDISGFSIRY